MPKTDNEKRFSEHFQLADQLMDVSDKEVVAEVARILAIHVAHYQSKYGKVPMEETLHLLHADTLTDGELGVAADAMEYLVAVLGVASGLADEKPIS